MSEEDQGDTSDAQLLTAEYKDGQLQIVEVCAYDKDKESHIVPDMISTDDQHKFMQVIDSSKGLVQLDLLNLTLVRCEDGDESYRLVANSESDGGDHIPADATVACVLHSSDGEEQDPQESYVMVDDERTPLVFLHSLQDTTAREAPPPPKKQLTPTEILEKAKALQRARALISHSQTRPGKKGRRRKGALPPPHELLASPDFKLYLYSCKSCSFKCNAVKELTNHKAMEHSGGAVKYRAGTSGVSGRHAAITLQCARCPYRGGTHVQLMKHVQEKHTGDSTIVGQVSLDDATVAAADTLVCGACGFESGSRTMFRRHIERVHGASTS